MALSDVKTLDLEIRADKARVGAQEFDRSANQVRGGAQKMGDALQRVERQLGTLRNAASNIFGAIGISVGIREVIQSTTGMQRYESALKAATRSSAEFNAENQFVRETTRALGLDLLTSGTEYAKLAIAARGAKLAVSDTRAIFLATANASAALGLAQEQSSRILNAFQQMLSKGVVSAEELRGQLGDVLPGAFGMAAKAMGMTEQKFNDLLGKGQILANDLIPKLSAAITDKFGAAAEAASDNLQANLNRLGTSWDDLASKAGQAGGVLNTIIKSVGGALQFLADNWNALASGVLLVMAKITGVVTAGVYAQIAAFRMLSGAMAALTPGSFWDEVDAKLGALQEQVRVYGTSLKESFSESSNRAIERQAEAMGIPTVVSKEARAELRRLAEEQARLKKSSEDLAGTFKQKLPESIEEYVRRVNQALAMLKSGPKSVMTFAIKFDEAGAKEAIKRAKALMFSAQRELLDQKGAAIRVEQTLGLITNDQAASKLRLLEIEYALNEAKALGLGITNAEADALRKQAEEREKANKKWGAVVSALDSMSQILGGSNTKIGQMVKLAADLAEAFRQIKTNVKGSQEAMAGWAGAIQAAAGIMQAAGIGKPKGGPAGFGGKGEGNYAAQGALWGSVIGGIIGSFIPVIGTAIGAALGSMIGGVVGSFIKSGADEALGNLVGDLTIAVTKAEGGLGHAMDEMSRKIHIGVNSILDAIGASLDALPGISFKIRDGVISVFSNGVKARFQSMDDAVLFAVAEILKNGQLSGLTEVMKTVLANTKAINLDELVRDLDFARFYENLGLDDVAISMQETLHKFAAFVRQATELGLDIAPLGAWLGKQFQAMRDQLLGIKKDPKEKLKADIEAYNQQLKLIRSEQEAKRADLLFKKADLQAKLIIARAEMELMRAELVGHQKFLEGEADVLSAQFELINGLVAAIAAVDAAFAGIDALLASLPDLISNDELQKALAALGNGGGGGGRSTAQGLIDEANRNKMPDWVGQLFDLQKKFDAAAKPLLPNNRADKIKKLMDKETDPKKLEELEKKYLAALRAAGLNAAALDKLNKARLDEINLLKQQVKDQYAPYLKNWGKSDFRAGISDFLKNLAEVPDALLSPFEKALIKARFLKEQNRDVTDRLKEFGGDLFPTAAIDDVRNTANGLRDDLAALAAQGIDTSGRLRLVAEAEAYRLQQIEFGLVDQLFGYLKGSAEFEAQRVEFEKQKVQLQFAVIEAQLRALGVWAKYEGLFNAAFKAAMDAAGQMTAATGGSSFESTVNTFADVIKEATDRWRNATRQIADFYRNLMFGNQSPLTGMQTVEAALAAYNSTAALARGGNLGAREQFTTVAQTLLDVLDRAYGSTEFSARLRAQIAADSQNLLGQTSFNDNGMTVAVSWNAVDRSVQDGTRRLVEAVQQAQASQAQGNGATTAAVVNLAQAILSSNGNSTDPELVSALQRIATLLEAEARRNAA